MSFYHDFCVFRDLFSGRVRGIGKKNGGLYILNTQTVLKHLNKDSNNSKGTITANVTIPDVKPWHSRLGHPSSQALRHLKLMDCRNDSEILNNCPVCPPAKQARLPFPSSTSRASTMIEVVHLDLWGPFHVPTIDKKHYFLTVVDDHSRFVWVYLLQLKSETIVAIKNFLLMIKSQFDSHVKVVRLDNGTQFFNHQITELFQHHDILHQSRKMALWRGSIDTF